MERKIGHKFRAIKYKLGKNMDFNDTPQEAKFRKKCRDWLEKNASYKDGSSKSEDFANKDKLNVF